MAESTLKYLLVWERMGHYHVARWRALQAVLGQANVHAADLAASDKLYGWQGDWTSEPEYHRLSDKSMDEKDAWGRFASFKRICRQERITALGIAGYYRPELIFMILWGWMTGRKVILFAESWYPGSKWGDRLKGWFLDWFCYAFLVSGDNARRHFADRLGIPENRIQTGYSVVDNAHFAKALILRPMPPSKVILSVARFSPEKNLGALIRAFKASGLGSEGWRLRLVGGGPQKEELAQLIDHDAAIEMREWVQYEDLPALYGDASVFCLPSTFEPWGLVVNEALAAGLTLVLSTEVGALPEARSHASVYRFTPQNENALTITLREACQREIITQPRSLYDLSPEAWAGKVVRMVGGQKGQ